MIRLVLSNFSIFSILFSAVSTNLRRSSSGVVVRGFDSNASHMAALATEEDDTVGDNVRTTTEN